MVTDYTVNSRENLNCLTPLKCKLRTDMNILTIFRGNRNSLMEGSSEYMWQRYVNKKCQEAETRQRDLKWPVYYLLWREEHKVQYSHSQDMELFFFVVFLVYAVVQAGINSAKPCVMQSGPSYLYIFWAHNIYLFWQSAVSYNLLWGDNKGFLCPMHVIWIVITAFPEHIGFLLFWSVVLWVFVCLFVCCWLSRVWSEVLTHPKSESNESKHIRKQVAYNLDHLPFSFFCTNLHLYKMNVNNL